MLDRTRTALHALVRLGTGTVGLIVLGTCLDFAQGSTATIWGVVRDAKEGVEPGVSVTARHSDSGLTRTVQSEEDGGYRMPSLPVVTFELTAEKLGFKQQVRR